MGFVDQQSQRWGLKDFHTDTPLVFLPALKEEEIFWLEPGKLTWLYPESANYQKLAENFPVVTVDKRCVTEWRASSQPKAGILRADLLYLSRYDFMAYRDFKGHPNDPLRLINADRFVSVFPTKNIADNLKIVGNFHLWLNYLRRAQIPGYVDCDTQEQFSVTWLIFATETEDQATCIGKELSFVGEELVRLANPCEIWTVSFEALEWVKEKQKIIGELLTLATRPIQRAV